MSSPAAVALLDALTDAAVALLALSSARYDAQHEPLHFRRLSPNEKRMLRRKVLATVTTQRAQAVHYLRTAQPLLEAEPERADGWELPEWPGRGRHLRPVDGPADLADVVNAAVESWDDDYEYAESLKQWVRAYQSIQMMVLAHAAPAASAS
jgi:hypothetical protein